VNQAFDTIFDLDEAAVVGDVRDLAEQARGRRIAAVDVIPGIITSTSSPTWVTLLGWMFLLVQSISDT
jgi:hypothetical protein